MNQQNTDMLATAINEMTATVHNIEHNTEQAATGVARPVSSTNTEAGDTADAAKAKDEEK